MKEKKLPFKSYTVMNNSVAYKLSCPDLYRFFVLSLTADKTTRKTDTTLEQLADFVGEKVTAYNGNKKSKSFTNRLRDSGEVDIESKDDISFKNGNRVTRNIYTFKEATPTQYRRISRSLIDLDLSVKLKGYIIKLFSIAEPHSYLISKSIHQMEKLLKMDKKTIKSYNEELITADLLEVTEDGFTLKVDSLIIDKPNRISQDVQSLFDSLEFGIDYKMQNDIKLSRSESIYINAKKTRFKDIRDMTSWAIWLMTGVPYKSKKEESVLELIM